MQEYQKTKEEVRLNKYLSEAGVCSRREADRLIESGESSKGITCVETFDFDFREKVLKKGITAESPQEIAKYADEVCLLFGLTGQTLNSMKKDIETGLSLFERVCINIMVENSTKMKPDRDVIRLFAENLYPVYIGNDRVDILMENTEFGVGDKYEQ